MRRGRLTLLAAAFLVAALLTAGVLTFAVLEWTGNVQVRVEVLGLVAFGQNRQALASQTVETYWTDIAHGKVTQAYAMLTPGNQESRPLKDYTQDMFGFLEQTGGIQFRVGTPSVSGDYATVPVTLHSPIPSQDLNAFQHLFWYNGQWRIADANGGLTHTK